MPRTLLASLLALALATAVVAAPEPQTEEQKTLYALGVILSRNLATFNLSAAEIELVKAGFAEGATGKPKFDPQPYGPKLQELQRSRAGQVAAVEKKSGQAFLDRAASEKGATRTASGLVIAISAPGAGESPKATDTVRVHYHGTLADGTVFDSSRQRNQPATFALNQVVKCWTEGLQLMKVGGKGRLVCPSDLAYGDQGRPPVIKPGATLVFEVELLEIVKK